MNDQTGKPAALQTALKAPAPSSAQQIQTYLSAPIPKLYANGIGTAPTPSDISIVFLHTGVATGIVTMPLSTAKSLAGDITQAIENFEKKTGQKVKDLRELTAKL